MKDKKKKIKVVSALSCKPKISKLTKQKVLFKLQYSPLLTHTTDTNF